MGKLSEQIDTFATVVQTKIWGLSVLDYRHRETQEWLNLYCTDATVGDCGVRCIASREIATYPVDDKPFSGIHASISFRDNRGIAPRPYNEELAGQIMAAIFGDSFRPYNLHVVPPETDEGKHWDVWHYYLRCDIDNK